MKTTLSLIAFVLMFGITPAFAKETKWAQCRLNSTPHCPVDYSGMKCKISFLYDDEVERFSYRMLVEGDGCQNVIKGYRIPVLKYQAMSYLAGYKAIPCMTCEEY